MPIILATSLQNPLVWAVLIGWILSVVLHEFAHGLVALWGGDYTIRERGGLSLNPLQYIDPLGSIIFPAIILLLGGLPLPGGSTYIRRELLRNRFWNTAVSLAGPMANLILFVLCALPFHPSFGWIDPGNQDSWSSLQIFLATMATLQFISVVLNLIPAPPLDGFQAISPYLPRDIVLRASTPPISTFAFFAYFMIILNSGLLGQIFMLELRLLGYLGYRENLFFFWDAYSLTFFGKIQR